MSKNLPVLRCGQSRSAPASANHDGPGLESPGLFPEQITLENIIATVFSYVRVDGVAYIAMEVAHEAAASLWTDATPNPWAFHYKVTAVDMTPCRWLYDDPRITYIQGDLLEQQLPPDSFDLIINCSVIEHVGLAGRYGFEQDVSDGDLECMAFLRRMIRHGGRMLLTLPVGIDAVFAP